MQRSFLGCVSETDAKEAREVGEKAVQCSIWKEQNGAVIIKRIGDYAVEYDLVNLEEIAAKTKTMPDNFYSSDTMISDDFIKYAAPLAGPLPVIGKVTAPRIDKIVNK
jgi:6-phosphofructokinase 1